jgi:hypothetical protein
MLLPLFTSVSSLLSKARIHHFENYSEGFCFYTALAANPSTGKSRAMKIVKEGFESVEEYLKIPHEHSKLPNGKQDRIL